MSDVASTPAWTSDPRLDAVARQLGALVHRVASQRDELEHADVLAATAALLALERSRGHLCVTPREWAGRALPFESGGDGIPVLPDAAPWLRALGASSLVGSGERATILVRDAADRLYLYRDHAAERRLADRLATLAKQPPAGAAETATCALFARIFPEAEAEGAALAAATALRNALTVITGGPGTGKTTVVMRILALLRAREPELRIALAAPTGKAAARLAAALEEQRAGLPVDVSLAAELPHRVTTLHRLLGYRPDEESFRYHARNPLRADLVVVDEASMIDLLLMDALVDALAPGTKLILLGDKDQLASVDAGYVLGDIVDAAGPEPGSGARSPTFSGWAAPLFAADLEIDPGASPLRDAVVGLTRNWRFETRPGIATLAAAVRAGDCDAALDVLADPRLEDVRRLDPPARIEGLLEPVQDHLRFVLGAADPVAALRAHDRLRVLGALRRGPWGVESLNRAVDQWARRRGVAFAEGGYAGRPVLVTRNHPELGLANGDVGVAWLRTAPDGTEVPSVAFERMAEGEPGLRWLSPIQLPAHEAAWALTVHKSQGSEYDCVVLVLPPWPHPLVTRELIYTAVTRARERVLVIASEAALRDGIAARGRRRSGLADRLVTAVEG